MWAFTVKFLRGVCVATDSGQWDETEWPIEPARFFMALAAAHFETCSLDADDPATKSQRKALEWLEQQSPPQVFAPDAETRTMVTVYVPVNDSGRADQLLSGDRSRQPRHFPTSIPHHDEIHFAFEAPPEDSVFEALEQIAFEVSRIGHSSSLVQVWVDRAFEPPKASPKRSQLHQWQPDKLGSKRLRVSSTGTMESLEQNFNFAAINKYAELKSLIIASKGVAKKKLKTEMTERFPNGLPPSHRPLSSMTETYKKTGSSSDRAVQSVFDSDMMLLTFHEAPAIYLESTLQLVGALRKRIHDAYPNRSSPEWLGGHQADGKPSKHAHLAIVPLPFAGARHADGHLLGLGLVFPRHISSRERAVELRSIFERLVNVGSSEAVGDWCVNLNLHNFRRLTGKDSNLQIKLVREQRLSPPRTLQSQSWTRGCTVWETVTPVVLDRFPKNDRQKNRQAWTDEVAAIISQSCENIGLPAPAAVHVHHNAFVRGIPKSRPKGGGFPPMPMRGGNASRYQIHVRIEFETPVQGPVILGAGRFVGYGFCRPNTSLAKQKRDGGS